MPRITLMTFSNNGRRSLRINSKAKGFIWRIIETIKKSNSCLVRWISYCFTFVWNVCYVLCSRLYNLAMSVLRCIPRRRKLEITTVIPCSAPAIMHFENELRRKRIRLNKVSSAYVKDKVLVICLNHSRLETDIDNALSQFRADEYHKIFLVIVHSVPKNELPGDSSKTRLMRLDKFKEIAEIVDMAFFKEQDCEWGFSTLSRAKTKLRSRLNNSTLNSLLMISMEGPDVLKFDYNKAVSAWAQEEKRLLKV